MAVAAAFDPPAGEDLSLLELPSRTDARRFEFSCRGDRVPLALWTPAAPSDGAALVFLPAPGGLDDVASSPALGDWLAAGVSVASIDLPLFGARRSPKMTEMLERAVADSAAGRPVSDNAQILWREFTRQSVLELRRTLDVLSVLGSGRTPRVSLAAAGLAASVGAIFYAVDPRTEGAFLAGPGRHGPNGVDPSAHLDGIGPRPLEVRDEVPQDLLAAAWSVLAPQLGRDTR